MEKDYQRIMRYIKSEKLTKEEERKLLHYKKKFLSKYKSKYKDSQKPEELVQLGIVYLNSDKPKEAFRCFKIATILDKKCIDAYMGLGELFQLIQNYEEAVKNYEKVLKLDINFSMVQKTGSSN